MKNYLTVLAAEVKNPFDGVTPDISLFGKEFDAKATVIMGGIWGVAIVVIAVWMILAAVKWGAARRQGQVVDGEAASERFQTAAWSMAACIGLPLIIGAIIWVLR